MKRLSLFLLLTLPLVARENPFKPVIDETVLPLASNKEQKPPPFKEATIRLPSDARVLTSIAIYYQTLDGSIKKEILSIDKSIDWHYPLLLKPTSSSKAGSQKAKSAAVKTVTSKKVERSKPKGDRDFTLKYAPLPFLQITLEPRRVHIKTSDRKIRAFHLSHPFKVAIDFARKAAFLTRHKSFDSPPYKAVDVGNHNGYYRVVITFDAPYRYALKKTADGYLLQLR